MKMCVWSFCFLVLCAGRASGQAIEAQQLLLNVEKLAQLKQMLSDLERGYEIVAKGYGTIKNIAEGSFSLHQVFLDGLLEVNPAVRQYKKVADIISLQLQIVDRCKAGAKNVSRLPGLSGKEIDYAGKVFSNLLTGSVQNLEALLAVMTPGTLRMSDGERLNAIDAIHKDMQGRLGFLHRFKNETYGLSLQRSRAQNEIHTTRRLYGITE